MLLHENRVRKQSGADAVRDAKSSMTADAKKGLPNVDQIRIRAFQIYVKRGNGPGDALSDWLQAEREINRLA